MSLKTINNFKIKPIITGGSLDPQKIRGSNLFPSLYPNIAIIGPKGHGKTTIVGNILDNLCYKNNVIIFSPSVYNDPTNDEIVSNLTNKRKCNVVVYDHFIDHETGENRIFELLKLLQEKENEKKEEDDKEEQEKKRIAKVEKEIKTLGVCNFGDPIKVKDDEPKRVTKTNPKTADYVVVYDDLGSDLRKGVYPMLIKNRHFKCINIMCLHNSVNITPASWGNVDYIILLGDIPEEKVLKIEEDAGIHFPSDSKHHSTLYMAYKIATEKPYDFLYLNRNTRELRQNFNRSLKI